MQKYHGRFYYRGTNYDRALFRWLRILADLTEGKDPDPNKPTVKALANRYLFRQQRKRDDGQLTKSSFTLCEKSTRHLVETLGKYTLLTDVSLADLEKLQ